jgi:threonine synthase
MERFNKETVTVPEDVFARAREHFDSYSVNDVLTVQTIREVWDQTEYLLDPHTACGVQAARALGKFDVPVITLATAHPAKFPDAVMQAGYPHHPELPHHMADLFQREERCEVLPHDLKAVQAFMQKNIRA